jgi:hypothetical protein
VGLHKYVLSGMGGLVPMAIRDAANFCGQNGKENIVNSEENGYKGNQISIHHTLPP